MQLLPAWPSLLLLPQETQLLCQPLQGRQASRNLLVSIKIGEAGYGDEHPGAKATMPVGWQNASMRAPPEACMRGRESSRAGAGEPQRAQAELQDGALHPQAHYLLRLLTDCNPPMVMPSLKPKYHPKTCA
jgi:hypothetical protein